MNQTISALLDAIDSAPHCRVYPPSGLPYTREGTTLPDDVRRFYERYGGCMLFEGSQNPIAVSSPRSFASSNLEVLGREYAEDISDSWHIVAREH